MAVSPQSRAFRSTPGFAPRQGTKNAFKPKYPTQAKLPEVEGIDDARAPNYVGRNLIKNRLGKLSDLYNPMLTDARAGAKQALAGYGGWQFQEDDPKTPEREDLLLDFDPSQGLGQRGKQAVRQQQMEANQQGLLYSSFANQNIAQAVQRLSLEAQGIATQYASDINRIFREQATEGAELVSDWTKMYGEDSRWLAEHPPPVNPEEKDEDAGGGEPAPAPAPAPQPESKRTILRQPDGKPVTWASKPNLKKLRQRFGPEVGLQQAGDGRWVLVVPPGGVTEPPAPKPAPKRAPDPAPNKAGNTILWRGANKPNPKTIRQRFGTNVRVVRAGNGQWVVARK